MFKNGNKKLKNREIYSLIFDINAQKWKKKIKKYLKRSSKEILKN